MKTYFLTAIAGCCFSSGVTAQSTISTTDKQAYSANAGWIDFRPSGADGVVVTESYLSGKAYAANFGWISLGDGSPDNGHTYSNASATDYGVNLNVAGELSGFAYSANVGWIRFENDSGMPRIDFASGRFSGYAYSANLGWIALDTQFQSFALFTTTLACPDTDNDGIGDAYEMFHFTNLTTADETSDSDGDGISDALEYAANTDPDDNSSYLRITSHAYSAAPESMDPALTIADLTFTSVENRLYSIEHDTDLAAPWTDSGLGIFPPAPFGAATTSRTFNFGPGPRHFFRVRAHRPLEAGE